MVTDINRVWCIYELAYWLRLMKKERWRKIKLIPVNRNAELYYGFPKYQGILFFMSGMSYAVMCVAVGMIGAYDGPDGTGKYDHGDVLLYGSGGTFGLFLIGLCWVGASWTMRVAPAKKEREKIVLELRKFDFAKVQASFPADKKLVKGLIVEMIRTEKGNENMSEDNCIEAFNKEVKKDVADKVDRLLKETETALTLSMLYTAVMTIILIGVYANLYAVDIVSSPIDQGFRQYLTINMMSFRWTFGAAVAGALVLFAIVMVIVNKKWDDKP